MNHFNSLINEQELSPFVLSNINEAISSCVFISRLVSDKIKRVSELEKDSKGKVIVDIEHPHILEDMDYFRQAALRFNKTGKYCDYERSTRKDSDYMKFWRREKERIINGLVREDGEWIPGTLYFYWNYSLMTINKKNSEYDDRKDALPDPYLGDYLLFHYLHQGRIEGLNGSCLKRRICGWSYKLGSLGVRNSVFFHKSHSFYLATLTDYLFEDGVVSKCWSILNHIAANTPFPKLKLVDKADQKIMGYKDYDGTTKGTESIMMGLSLNDKYDKHRGKRGAIFFEEFGDFINIDKAWMVGVDNVKMGKFTIAQLICGGTGGSSKASFEAAQKMFYNPLAYFIKPINNIFDKENGSDSKCGFFWGSYLNVDGFNDKDGNPDVIGALIDVYKTRENLKSTSVDRNMYVQRCAEQPVYPSEAMMKSGESFFPVIELQEHLTDVIRDENRFLASHVVAKLYYRDNKTVWYKPDFDNKPIRMYPLLGNNPVGCVELFYPPTKDVEIPKGINIIGVDPVDDDYNAKGSLASAFVFNLYEDRIIAEITGRPKFADDFFEDVLKLSIMYNADVMYENNKKMLFNYFDRKNQCYRLMDTPAFLKATLSTIPKINIGNRVKGYYNTGQIKISIIKDFEEYSRSENPIEKRMNLYTIRSLGLIREMINFSPESGNYDRISAMGSVMLARQVMKKYIESNKTKDEKSISNLYSDPAFVRMYGDSIYSNREVQNKFGINS